MEWSSKEDRGASTPLFMHRHPRGQQVGRRKVPLPRNLGQPASIRPEKSRRTPWF